MDSVLNVLASGVTLCTALGLWQEWRDYFPTPPKREYWTVTAAIVAGSLLVMGAIWL